jgi:hypothetical protein
MGELGLLVSVAIHESGTDMVVFFDMMNEDSSITDIAGFCGFHHRADDIVHLVIFSHNFNHGFGKKRNFVLRAAIHHRVTFLPPMASDVIYRHSGYDGCEFLNNSIELIRLNNALK